MKVKSESEVTQSCPTLSDKMDCSLLSSSVHGIFQAGVLEWVAIAFPITYAVTNGRISFFLKAEYVPLYVFCYDFFLSLPLLSGA